MQWRLKMMACAVHKNEISLLKLLIGFKRSEAEKSVQLIDPVTKKPTKKLDRVGQIVKEIFPLLDPDLSEVVAKQAHKKSSEANNVFMTQTREAILQYCT